MDPRLQLSALQDLIFPRLPGHLAQHKLALGEALSAAIRSSSSVEEQLLALEHAINKILGVCGVCLLFQATAPQGGFGNELVPWRRSSVDCHEPPKLVLCPVPPRRTVSAPPPAPTPPAGVEGREAPPTPQIVPRRIATGALRVPERASPKSAAGGTRSRKTAGFVLPWWSRGEKVVEGMREAVRRHIGAGSIAFGAHCALLFGFTLMGRAIPAFDGSALGGGGRAGSESEGPITVDVVMFEADDADEGVGPAPEGTQVQPLPSPTPARSNGGRTARARSGPTPTQGGSSDDATGDGAGSGGGAVGPGEGRRTRKLPPVVEREAPLPSPVPTKKSRSVPPALSPVKSAVPESNAGEINCVSKDPCKPGKKRENCQCI
jgi:hypothetical protein